MAYGLVSWPRHAQPYGGGMRDVLVTPPAVEPVTLAEAKSWAEVSNPSDDQKLSDLIVACRRRIENDLGQALITQTRAAFYGGFPYAPSFRLPRVPIQSVEAIEYADGSGNTITLPTATYAYSAPSMAGVIRLAYLAYWPVAQSWEDAVQVQYTCGYGDSADDVPMEIRIAIRSLIATNYAMRESHFFQQGGVVLSNIAYDNFLDSVRHNVY